MTEVPNTEELKKKRRSTRVKQSVPITVSGSDALGRRFREHTITATVNCHGCKFLSKHYLLAGTRIELEVASRQSDGEPRKVGARVAWTERPKSLTEPFQVGVELETPGNIWGLEFPPEDWFHFPGDEPASKPPTEAASRPALKVVERHTPPAPPEPEAPTEPVAAEFPPTPTQKVLAAEAEVAAPTAEDKSQGQAVPAGASLTEIQSALDEALDEIRNAAQKNAEALRAQWHTELESELDRVSATLEARIAEAIQRAVTEAESRLHQQTEAARASVDVAQSSSEESFKQFEARLADAVQRVLDEAETTLCQRAEAARTAFEFQNQNLESQVARTQQTLASSAERAEALLAEFSKRMAELERRPAELETASKHTLQEFQQEMARTLAEHTARLEQTANSVLEQVAMNIQATAESIAPQVAERVLVGLEQQVSTHLGQVQQALAQLDEAGRTTGARWQQLRQQLAEEAERLSAPHIERLAGTLGELLEAEKRVNAVWQQQEAQLASAAERVFERVREDLHIEMERHLESQSGIIQEKLGKHITALDDKITELTHTGYEGLLKACEWYQKKARSGMDTALKQSLEQMGIELRARAADLSQRFTAELERHSRGFVEHTREILEAESQAVVQSVRPQLSEAAERAFGAFREQLSAEAEARSGSFTENLAQQAQKQGEALAHYAERIAAETRERVQHDQQELLAHATEQGHQQLAAAVSATLREMQTVTEQRRSAWQDALERSAIESLEEYKRRLENITNAWLLTSAARLNEHSETLLLQLQQKIEAHLCDAVSEVMSRVMESLRRPPSSDS